MHLVDEACGDVVAEDGDAADADVGAGRGSAGLGQDFGRGGVDEVVGGAAVLGR